MLIDVACVDEACSARVIGTIRTPKAGSARAKLFTASKNVGIAKGAKATVRLSLSAAARTAITRALKLGKQVGVKIAVTAKDAVGNKRTETRSVKLKR